MSRTQQTKANKGSNPIVIVSGLLLAAVALVGGFWLGGVFSGGATQTAAPASQPAQANVPPADAGYGANDAAVAAGDTANTMASGHGSADASSGGMSSSGMNSGATNLSADDGAADPSGMASTDEGMSNDTSNTGAPDQAQAAIAPAVEEAPAIDPADLYQVTYSDHEPEALSAAAEGRLGTPALVMFHADWCHVCQEVMPTVHQLRDQYEGEVAVVKVNVDQREPVMASYPVRGTPTFVFFDRNGEQVKTQRGWPGENLMAQYMDMSLAIQ